MFTLFSKLFSYFHVDRKIMPLFYKSCIESVLTFSIMCWYGNLNIKAKNSISKIVELSGKILGAQQSPLSELFSRQVRRKAQSILLNAAHPLFNEFCYLPSGSRLRFIQTFFYSCSHFKCWPGEVNVNCNLQAVFKLFLSALLLIMTILQWYLHFHFCVALCVFMYYILLCSLVSQN